MKCVIIVLIKNILTKMNKKIILPLFLASIMILSIIGFSLNSTQSDTSSIKYNGYSFKQTEQGWITFIGNNPILISQNPNNLNEILLPDITLQEINSANKIYFTFNPEDNIQSNLYYFDANIRTRLKNFILSCTVDIGSCSNLPLKTCKDADSSSRIIQVSLANQSSITYENNCLLIQGQKQELPSLIDAVILKLLLQ